MAALLKAFGGTEANATAGVDTSRGRLSLDDLRAKLARFARETVSATGDVNVTQGIAHLEELEVLLHHLNGENVSATADLNIAKAIAKAAEFRAALHSLGVEGGSTRQELAGLAEGLAVAIGKIGPSLETDTEASTNFFKNFVDGISGAKTSIGPLSLSLANLGKALDILLPIIGAIVAAIVSLGASLGAAIAGLGALGAAGVAATGPILALALGAVTSFTRAQKALTEWRQKVQAARSAEQQLTQADAALAQAHEGVARAQADLNRARADAAQQIADNLNSALEAESQAEYDLTQAQQSQRDAQTALTEARINAIRSLQDLRLGVKDAALQEQEARINLTKAQQELNAVEASGVGGLALREARLRVKEAEQQLTESKIRGTRAQQDLNTAEAKGVAGNDQVVAAREQLAQATHDIATSQQAVADAVNKVNEAEAKTVNTDSQVISSRRALTDAHRQVAQAEQRVAQATQAEAIAQRQANQAHRQALPLLHGVGKNLLQSIRQVKAAFRDMTSIGTRRIWQGVIDSIHTLIPTMKSLKGDFGDLGTAIANAFRKVAKTFSSPVWVDFFKTFIHGAAQILPVVTKVFLGMARIFANISKAAMPLLVSGLRSINGAISDIAKGTSNVTLVRLAIGGLVDQASSWIKLLLALGNAIFQIGRAAAGPGQNLVDWLTQSINKFNAWASSTEGQASIKDFFTTMLPLIKNMLTLLVELSKVGIKWAELMVPALNQLITLLTPLVQFLNTILGVLNSLPGPAKTAIGALLLFKGPVGTVKLLISSLRILGGVLVGDAVLGGVSTLSGALGEAGLMGTIGTLTARLPALGAALKGAGFVAAGAGAFFLGKKLGDVLFNTDQITQAYKEADKQARINARDEAKLSDRLAVINKAMREFPKQFPSEQAFLQALGKNPPWHKIEESWHKHGNLASSKFVQGAIDRVNQARSQIARRLTSLWNSSLGDFLKDILPKARSIGQSIVNAIGEAFNNPSRLFQRGMKSLGKHIRDWFPGSEPKEPSSPLRNLKAAGEAIVKNIAEGITSAHADAPKFLAARMAHDIVRVPAGAEGGGRGDTTNHNLFDMRPTFFGASHMDAERFMADIVTNMRKRGMSLT